MNLTRRKFLKLLGLGSLLSLYPKVALAVNKSALDLLYLRRIITSDSAHKQTMLLRTALIIRQISIANIFSKIMKLVIFITSPLMNLLPLKPINTELKIILLQAIGIISLLLLRIALFRPCFSVIHNAVKIIQPGKKR